MVRLGHVPKRKWFLSKEKKQMSIIIKIIFCSFVLGAIKGMMNYDD